MRFIWMKLGLGQTLLQGLGNGNMMGKGYWLNPRTSDSWIVGRHEVWVLENPICSGVPFDVHAHLLTLDPHKGMDEIRLAAINAGLIRLREYAKNWSVQFAATKEPAGDLNEEMVFLRSVFLFLDEIVVFKDTPLVIGNFSTRVETTITLRELGRKVNS